MDEAATRRRMQGALEALIKIIGTIRTGRATPSLVENLEVAVYGGAQKLRILELASISTSDPQTLVIDPWDKSIIGEIKKGIEAANIGMNPVIDGEIIRITLPALTTEDREKYVKLLSAKLEESKVSVRQIRGEVLKNIRREFEEKTIREDEMYSFEKNLQALTDEFVAKVDQVGEKKKAELLQI